ncbi:MAG: aminotransferase class V-fold PLP-dependent enzyme, partial [bacterium]|nr:aminotransferase class V-fold PLP-dependent enzyme [bacterium]
MAAAERLYLDHAATTPMLPAAKAAMVDALDRWANPSSPHADGRAARAALETARARVAALLGWPGSVLFTSGASEAIAIGLGGAKAAHMLTSPVEHDSVLRVTPDATRLAVDGAGMVSLKSVRAELV